MHGPKVSVEDLLAVICNLDVRLPGSLFQLLDTSEVLAKVGDEDLRVGTLLVVLKDDVYRFQDLALQLGSLYL